MLKKNFQKFKNNSLFKYLYHKNYYTNFFLNLFHFFPIMYSGNWSEYPYPGKYNRLFLKSFLNFQKIKYGLLVANGTVATNLAFKVCNIKQGSNIIVPALTYHTTVSSALELGYKISFADINKDTLCIDIDLLEKKIKTKKYKCVLYVHLGSLVQDIYKISKICKKHNVKLIEDCSHVHGAQWNSRGIGSFGDCGIFSFQKSKLIQCGEGGLITVKEKKNYLRALSLINCGKNYLKPHTSLGQNYRITEIQSLILLKNLKYFFKKVKNINNNINYINKILIKNDNFEILNFSRSYNFKSGYYYGLKLSYKLLKKMTKKKFISKCNKLGLKIHDKIYDILYENPEFGYKDSLLLNKINKNRCKVAEQELDQRVIWINYIYFISGKNPIDQIINTFELITNSSKN